MYCVTKRGDSSFCLCCRNKTAAIIDLLIPPPCHKRTPSSFPNTLFPNCLPHTSQLSPSHPCRHYLQRQQICITYLVSLYENREGLGSGLEKQSGQQMGTKWTAPTVLCVYGIKGKVRCDCCYPNKFSFPETPHSHCWLHFHGEWLLGKGHMRWWRD